MNNKIFIDSDIILDVLAERGSFYKPAAELFDLGVAKKLDLYTTAVVLANVFYIIRKKNGVDKSREHLKKLRLILGILPINEKTVDDVLVSKITDFEDGLQYFSAREHSIPVIITRNTKDYREKDVAVLSAEEFLGLKSTAFFGGLNE